MFDGSGLLFARGINKIAETKHISTTEQAQLERNGY